MASTRSPTPPPIPLTSSSSASSPPLLPIIAALSKPEALQPSAASAAHLVQLLSLAIDALSRRQEAMSNDNASEEVKGASNDVGDIQGDRQGVNSFDFAASVPQHHLNTLISHPQLLRIIRAHLRTGDPPAALPAVRLLAILLSIPLMDHLSVGSNGESNNKARIAVNTILKRLHTGVLVSGNGGGNQNAQQQQLPNPSPLLGDLLGMVRAQDPLLTPPCVAALHGLATGPCWHLAGVVFVSSELREAAAAAASSSSSPRPSSLLFILRKLHATALHRASAEAIFASILSTREGIRWATMTGVGGGSDAATSNSAIIDMTVAGSAWLQREWNAVKTMGGEEKAKEASTKATVLAKAKR